MVWYFPMNRQTSRTKKNPETDQNAYRNLEF